MTDDERLEWQADCDRRARLAELRLGKLCDELGVAIVFEAGNSSAGGQFTRIVCSNVRPEPAGAPPADPVAKPQLVP